MGGEAVQSWVKPAGVDDEVSRASRPMTQGGSRLGQELRELRHSNAILESASAGQPPM
jgi:hypothetical protein